ncbi:hypothetical protein MKX03_028087, partial [Papaver bracteatum]
HIYLIPISVAFAGQGMEITMMPGFRRLYLQTVNDAFEATCYSGTSSRSGVYNPIYSFSASPKTSV